MGKGRLEAFSDGVIAIIITIMVLELKVPHGHDLETLRKLLPIFLSYVLSFVFVAIYWSNHHHLLHVAKKVDAKVMWANMHLLFWLSMVPFVTGWLGEHHHDALPTAAYGIVLILCGIAYAILQTTILAHHPKDSAVHKALAGGRKEALSTGLYFTAIVVSFYQVLVADVIYAVVAAIWLVPDPRIAKLHDD